MKSITIHGLDDPLDGLIREKAKSEGISLNKTIKKMLEESLGVKPKNPEDRKKDFLDLFGIWSEKDAEEFDQSIKDFERIDPEDWA